MDMSSEWFNQSGNRNANSNNLGCLWKKSTRATWSEKRKGPDSVPFTNNHGGHSKSFPILTPMPRKGNHLAENWQINFTDMFPEHITNIYCISFTFY